MHSFIKTVWIDADLEFHVKENKDILISRICVKGLQKLAMSEPDEGNTFAISFRSILWGRGGRVRIELLMDEEEDVCGEYDMALNSFDYKEWRNQPQTGDKSVVAMLRGSRPQPDTKARDEELISERPEREAEAKKVTDAFREKEEERLLKLAQAERNSSNVGKHENNGTVQAGQQGTNPV